MFFVAAERGLQKNRGHPVLSRRRTAVRVPVFQIPVFRAAALSHRLRHRFCTAGGHRVPAQPPAFSEKAGLAAAGGIVGGGMVAGVFVLAAPVAVLGGVGVGVASHLKNKQLRQEKERLYKEALSKHDAIIKALKEEADADKERMDYLQSLNILLQRAITDLQKDLGMAI